MYNSTQIKDKTDHKSQEIMTYHVLLFVPSKKGVNTTNQRFVVMALAFISFFWIIKILHDMIYKTVQQITKNKKI